MVCQMLLELYEIIYPEEAGSAPPRPLLLHTCRKVKVPLRELVDLSSSREFSRVLNLLSSALQ